MPDLVSTAATSDSPRRRRPGDLRESAENGCHAQPCVRSEAAWRRPRRGGPDGRGAAERRRVARTELRFPFTTNQDLRDNYRYGMLAVPGAQLRRTCWITTPRSSWATH